MALNNCLVGRLLVDHYLAAEEVVDPPRVGDDERDPDAGNDGEDKEGEVCRAGVVER